MPTFLRTLPLLAALACAPAGIPTGALDADPVEDCTGLPAVRQAPEGFEPILGKNAFVAFGEICNPSAERQPIYTWTVETAPRGSLVDSDSLMMLQDHEHGEARLEPDVMGAYVVSVFVSDPEGNSSDGDYLIITRGSGTEPPLADCGESVSARVGDRVTLDGHGSNDPEGAELDYDWSLSSVPACSLGVPIDDSTSATPSLVPDCAGLFVVGLIVNDGDSWSNPDFCLVTAS